MYELLILGYFSVLYGLIPSCTFIIFDLFSHPYDPTKEKMEHKAFVLAKVTIQIVST